MKLYRCWDSAVDVDEASNTRSFNLRQHGAGPEGGFGSALNVQNNIPGADAGAGGVAKGKGKGKSKNKGKNKQDNNQNPAPAAKVKTPEQIAKAVAWMAMDF